MINLNTVVRSMYGSMIEFRAEVKKEINSLRGDLNALNESVSEISTCLQEHKQHIAGELEDLHIKIGTFDCLNTSQHTEQLTQCQTYLNSKLDTTHSKLDSVHSKLDSLTATTAQLSSDHQQIQANISDVKCLELNQNLKDNLTHQLEKIQDDVTYMKNMHGPYTCGGTGGWRRVVYLDMTDSSTTCPSGWNMTGYSKRACGRTTDGTNTRDSATFPVRGEYTRICGRIRAYQSGSPDAFWNYHTGRVTTIDGAYVDGVSVTHGSPQNHIWTFAAGYSEGNPTDDGVCPCDSTITRRVPPFMADDYFCESGVNGRYRQNTFNPSDTLWDGQDCLPSSTCCSRRNPPYFIKQLSTSTTDDIEVRICLNEQISNEDIAVELVELYVQ